MAVLILLIMLCQDYKTRMVKWEKAMTVWRSFHCDLKDLTSWLNRVERIIADSKMPNGDLNVDAAMSEQRVRIVFILFVSFSFILHLFKRFGAIILS